MKGQLSFIDIPKDTAKGQRLKWERAFQKWSNESSQEGHIPYGCCGYGFMCDFCGDNSYGWPCARTLNKMKGIKINYEDFSEEYFERVWNGEINDRD